MGRRIAIGLAWGLAVAYGWQFMANMYGFPAVGPVAALLVAAAVAASTPRRRRRPSDRRQIYRPGEAPAPVGATPSTYPNS